MIIPTQWMKPLVNFFMFLDKKQMQRILIGTVAATLCLFGFFVYVQYQQSAHFKAEMAAVNKARIRVKEILERNEILKEQQKRGEEILAKDKNFKLKEYLNTVVSKLGLNSNFRAGQVTTNDLEHMRVQGYEEIKIDADIVNISTKTLVDFISELESNERIDIKKLEISKSQQAGSIDVKLSIGTLQQKTLTSQEFEAE